jgi:hypothetical protein
MLRRLAQGVVLGTLVLVAACNRPVKPSAPAEPAKPDAVVTADELLEQYKKNEIAADQKYKDKLVEVSGKVAEVKKAPILGYYVALGSPQEGEMFDIMCYLDTSAEADAAKLNKGDSVTLLGYCRGRAAGVILNFKSCVIVK